MYGVCVRIFGGTRVLIGVGRVHIGGGEGNGRKDPERCGESEAGASTLLVRPLRSQLWIGRREGLALNVKRLEPLYQN